MITNIAKKARVSTGYMIPVAISIIRIVIRTKIARATITPWVMIMIMSIQMATANEIITIWITKLMTIIVFL